MRPVRAALVNHYTGFGGAEAMLLTALEGLDRDRVDPVLFTPDEGRLTAEARALGVRVRTVPVAPALLAVARGGAASHADAARALAALPAAARRLARALAAERAEVVMTNSAKAHVYGSLAAGLARRPLLWRMHDTITSPDFAASLRRVLVAIGRRLPRRVLAVSDAAGAALVAAGIPAERVRTLYNGIALAPFAAAAPPPGGRTLVLGSVGRLTPLKGHEVAVACVADLAARGVDARLVVAGAAAREAPGHDAALRAHARALGVAGRVEVVSPFSDLVALLGRLDLVLHASVLPDSLPTTLIEAMAAGRPAVATRVGGVPELVRDGREGLLVPPGDAGAMAGAVAALAADPARRAAMAAAARARARRRFDLPAFVDALAGAMERQAGRPPRPAPDPEPVSTP